MRTILRTTGNDLTRALGGGVCAAALLGLTVGAPVPAFAAAAQGSAAAAPAPAAPTPTPTAAKPAAPVAKAQPKPKKPPKPEETDDEDTELSGVVVSANVGYSAQPGAVIGDIKPELQLSPSDIQSYGVSTVTELLDELAPQTQSDRGRGGEAPVVLLNGKPISGMNEIRNIPTEAILRIDILPEEVALKYGYAANQRVVNVVLRRFFRSVTGEAGVSGPTEGGQLNGSAEADQFSVRRDDRLNLDLKYSASTDLTEDSRNLTPLSDGGAPFALAGNVVPVAPAMTIPSLSALTGQPVTVAGVPGVAATRAPTLSDFVSTANNPNVSDIGRYRTLAPATQSVTANGVLARAILGGNGAINMTLGATSSRGLQGLPGVGLAVPANDPFSPFGAPVTLDRYVDAFGPLRQNTDGWTAHLGGSFNRALGKWRLSLTGNYDHTNSETLSDTGVDATALQAALNAATPGLNPFGPLPANLLGRLARNKALSVQDSGNLRLLLNGSLFKVPAGQVTTSLRINDSVSGFYTRSERLGVSQTVSLSRNVFNGQINVDLPVTSKKNHVLGFIGDLSLNANTALDHVSGFGNLQVLGYGLNWTPLTGVSLIVSHTRDQQAPTVAQLGGPVLVTPNVRLLDYLTGQTVDVTKITGGTAALLADHRDVLKIGLTWKPFAAQDLTFTANYISSKIRNPITTFPAATAQIEAAFPDRFLRDDDGDLIEVDYRPVNFAEQDRKELRWGLNFTHKIGKPPPTPEQRRTAFEQALAARGITPEQFRAQLRAQQPNGQGGGGQGGGGQRRRGGQARPQNGAPAGADGAQPAPPTGPDGQPLAPPPGGGPPPGGPPDGGGGPGGPGGFGGGGRGGGPGGFGGGGFGGGRGGRGGGGGGAPNAQGQIQLALYHTVIFDDRILVRQGGPLLDLLNGAAAGNGGGQPRHQIQAQAGITMAGWGARASATWQSATTVDTGALSTTGPLHFGSLAEMNLRLFANLGQMPKLVENHPFLKGTRLTLSLNNLFDTRQRVTDVTGATPVSYQGAYLDPEGRTVHLDFRKLFF